MSTPEAGTTTEGLSPFQKFVSESKGEPATADGKTEDQPQAVPQGAEPRNIEENPIAPEPTGPTTIQDLVRQRVGETQEEPTAVEGDAHDVFTDLLKPGKGSSKGDQINYVKEVGNRWKERAEDLQKQLEEASSKTFDPTETEEWKSTQAELDKYKTEAEKVGELKEQLAAVDLKYDPVFQNEITIPMGEAEQGILDIINVSKGEDAGELIPKLQQAIGAASEADFLGITREISQEIDPHFAVAVFEGLKNIRSLKKKGDDYMANHQETSTKFIAERQTNNKANAEKFIKSDWKDYRGTAEGAVTKTWDLLKSLGNDDLEKSAMATKDQTLSWTKAGLEETISQYGGVSASVAQTMALAPELLSLLPLVDKSLEYMKTQKDEHDKLKTEYQKLVGTGGSTGSRTNRTSAPTSGDQPDSLVAFARQQGTL